MALQAGVNETSGRITGTLGGLLTAEDVYTRQRE